MTKSFFIIYDTKEELWSIIIANDNKEDNIMMKLNREELQDLWHQVDKERRLFTMENLK